MVRFTVNGKPAELEKSAKLMPYLRDVLGLTSVKNGCAEGACGACMVLLDGKAMRACVLKAAQAEGKEVLTVEGFSARERAVYAHAFTAVGAVQCGFCIPGMVVSAKALLDAKPDPTPAEVKQAIRGNICRCTGYRKIEEAILLAAKLLRENTPVPEAPEAVKGTVIGLSYPRVDAAAKAIGEAKYAGDIQLPGMLYGSALRSAHPRARVLAIHTEKAKALPGVVAVLTAADIPGAQRIGHLKQDWDVLIPIGGLVHTRGDSIALVAAESREALAEAKKLIEVEYEVLPGVFTPSDAIKPGAPLVHEETESNVVSHEHLVRGDAKAKLAASAHVVTHRYTVPFTDHAFLEPECAVALPAALDPECDGSYLYRIYSGDQGVYQTRKECAAMLGLEQEQVRVTAMAVGGGFGGKEDMSVQQHAALLAYHTGKPVQVQLTREESLLVHPKRHAMEMEFTTGCDEEGHLTALKATILADGGAYASLGGPVLQRACTHAAGPYNYQDIEIEGTGVYTNNPPAGAFRGFGVTQSCFATECNLNHLAELVGITPYEMRLRNAIRPGQVLPNGQIADEDAWLIETLEAVRPYVEAHPDCGIACAMKNSGLGVGVPDTGRCRLLVEGGKVHILSSAACIGQGMGTVQLQMAAETAGLSTADFVYEAPDTLRAPNAGNTTASRQTLFTGEAAIRAAEQLKAALAEAGSLAALEGRDFLGEYTGVTDPLGSDKANPVSHIAYGYATHVVLLDEAGRLQEVVAAHDVGRAVNPNALTGQIEGGVVMSLGYALTEDFPLEEGKPLAKFGTLGLFRATDTPKLTPITLGYYEGRPVPAGERPLAYGAKGVGEICSIPTAPAVQLAYYNRDKQFRTDLPLRDTPYSRKKK